MTYIYCFIEPLHTLTKLVLSLSSYYKIGTQDVKRLSTLQCVIYQGSLCPGRFHYEIHILNHGNILLDLFKVLTEPRTLMIIPTPY